MDTLNILADFRVYAIDEDERERRIEYTVGQVVEEADVPAGQSAEDWIAKGLAEAA